MNNSPAHRSPRPRSADAPTSRFAALKALGLTGLSALCAACSNAGTSTTVASTQASSSEAVVRPLTDPTTPPQNQAPRASARIFFSGHSLMDNPVPSDVAAIAASLGTSLAWNRQYVVGSSVRLRSRGSDPNATAWPGYQQGDNREGRNLDVLQELRQPRTLGTPGPYDALVIAEGSGVLGSLMYFDTVRYLRHYHERFIEGAPSGQTYLYQPWSNLVNKQDPTSWIAFERDTSRAWQCVVARVNVSLQAEGRADRILPLPANAALAELVARASSGTPVPGLTAGSTRETIDRLFNDNIHTTRLGAYYMALVTYASVYRRSPESAWAPESVSPELARQLQTFAWGYVSDFYRQRFESDLTRCREFLTGSFCSTYWAKEGSTRWGGLKSVQQAAECRWRFWRNNAENPMHMDPRTDKDHWFKAP